MPKQGTRAEVNTFVKGLITEASPLNFPANASLAEENYELHRDGTRSRRAGMDFEEGYAFVPTTTYASYIETTGLNTFRWLSVEGNSEEEFVVAQVGSKLYFFNLTADSLSSTGVLGNVATTFPSDSKYSFATVNGKLVVAAGQDTVAIISYSSGTGVFTVTYVSIKVRDLWGIEVPASNAEFDPSYQPPVPIGKHIYNLMNQSWGLPRKAKITNTVTKSIPSGGIGDYGADAIITYTPVTTTTVTYEFRDPILTYAGDLKVYPSNSEVIWTGLQFQPIYRSGDTVEDPYERMFTNLYKERMGGTAVAAKGYFIIDALRRGDSRTAAVEANYAKHNEMYLATLVTRPDITTGGASVLAEFAGRVFYAGFNGEVQDGDARSPILNNYIFFSQLVKQIGDINKCYQEGDPTSREDSEIVDTDGGFIRIAGAKRIIAMRNIGTNLIVLADNGVWSISGGSNFGFTATSYKVDKISSYGCLSEGSVVVEGSQLLFWAVDGIYIVNKNQFGDPVVSSITQTTIQTLYDDIPITSKQNVFGEYDSSNKKIRWMYRDGPMFNSATNTYELVLDTVLGAIYKNRIMNSNTNTISLVGMFPSSPFTTLTELEQVQANTDDVIVGTSSVYVPVGVVLSGVQSMRYLVLHKEVSGNVSLTFSSYNNLSFRDWQKLDSVGVDAKAFLLTGQLTAGDSATDKQAPYITIHFNRTEENVDSDGVPLKQSSCMMRSQWDWSNNPNSHKFGRLVQTYKYRKPLFVTSPLDTYDNGFETIVSKNKLRGRGKALSVYFETEPYKDCQILGWSLTLNGNGIT